MRFNETPAATTDDPSRPAAVRVPKISSQEIAALFEQATAAWNAGDLAGFLGSYDRSPRTSYVNASQIVMGYAAIETLYASRLGVQGAAAMGCLSMTLSSVALLGTEHAHAIGRFQVSRADVNAGSESGVFSVVLRHGADGWRVIADHTSS